MEVYRKIVRWKQGIREEKSVVATPFGEKRAEEIFAKKASDGDLANAMSDGEIAYVMAVWDELKSGSSNFNQAFQLIRNGQIVRSDDPYHADHWHNRAVFAMINCNKRPDLKKIIKEWIGNNQMRRHGAGFPNDGIIECIKTLESLI